MRVKRNWIDNLLDVLCVVTLLAVSTYLLIRWNSIPSEIPGHYNALGQIDRMGSKGELLVLPIASTVMYIVLTVLEQFPQMWNTGVTITEENKERVYRVLKYMIETIKFLVVVVFGYICINSSLAQPLGAWFLPVFIGLMFGSIAIFLIWLHRVK